MLLISQFYPLIIYYSNHNMKSNCFHNLDISQRLNSINPIFILLFNFDKHEEYEFFKLYNSSPRLSVRLSNLHWLLSITKENKNVLFCCSRDSKNWPWLTKYTVEEEYDMRLYSILWVFFERLVIQKWEISKQFSVKNN